MYSIPLIFFYKMMIQDMFFLVMMLVLIVLGLEIASISNSIWFQQDFEGSDNFFQGGLIKLAGGHYTYYHYYNEVCNDQYFPGFCDQFIYYYSAGIIYIFFDVIVILLYFFINISFMKSVFSGRYNDLKRVRIFLLITAALKLFVLILWGSLVLLVPYRENQNFILGEHQRKSVWPKEGAIISILSTFIGVVLSLYFYCSTKNIRESKEVLIAL